MLPYGRVTPVVICRLGETYFAVPAGENFDPLVLYWTGTGSISSDSAGSMLGTALATFARDDGERQR